MRLTREQDGAVFVEATITMIFMLVFVLGSIDFLFAFYQRNLAAKALQIGARIAAVSDPVAYGLDNLTNAAAASFPPGSQMPSFVVRCDGGVASCTCTGFCLGIGGFDQAAMNTIIFGRGSSSCSDATSVLNAGMCDIFPRIRAANIAIAYIQTGHGYVARPGGPVPMITIELQNLPFQFFFLGDLIKLKTINITGSTAILAEDLSSRAPF